MKRMLCVSLMITAGFALAADVTYTEPPADTSLIRVEGGMTTVAGLEAYSHLTHYWSFDDADDPYADSVGNLPLQAVRSGDPVWKTGEDAKRGGAMWTSNGFKAPTNFIDGKHPFTICFWLKGGETINQATLVHIGQRPDASSEICDYPYMRLSFANSKTSLFLWENHVTHKSGGVLVQGVWAHIALTCEPIVQEGCVTTNNYDVYINGAKVAKLALSTPQNEYQPTDNLQFGNGWHYQNASKAITDAIFDEIMCFDRTLTAQEIAAFKDYSAPVDFSAGWDIAADGTLDIFGREPLTALKGEGVAKTLETTRLEASSNAWFAGSVQSPAFAFAGEASVTQTLSGANAWTGATTVESGTLEISASPVELFGDALVAWYPFEDATNPGRDFSPRGNNLSHSSKCLFEVSERESAGFGQALFLTNNTEVSVVGFYSSACLEGFTPRTDNSYTVAFWMRTDKFADNSGPFNFAKGQNNGASGLIVKSSASSVRYGDSGNACSSSIPFAWGDKNWHHIAVVYDSAAAAQGQDCHYLFVDGMCKGKDFHFNAGNTNHAATAFTIGRGFSANAIFDGALDEMIVLNTCDTNDVAKLYALRRTRPEAATGVLPTGTAVTVEEGATLKLTAANETVAQLFGKGTIDLSGNSKLTVTTKDRFEGTVVGGTITDEPGAERRGLVLIVK